MDTKILYYKIFEGKVMAVDYVDWAIQGLMESSSTISLNVLASLREPLNIFEVEDYFQRAVKDLHVQIPTHEDCATCHIHHLLRIIVEDDDINIINVAYEIYNIVSEHLTSEEAEDWYLISEMIDDFQYGDNIRNITWDSLVSTIKLEAEKQVGSKFFLNYRC